MLKIKLIAHSRLQWCVFSSMCQESTGIFLSEEDRNNFVLGLYNSTFWFIFQLKVSL